MVRPAKAARGNRGSKADRAARNSFRLANSVATGKPVRLAKADNPVNSRLRVGSRVNRVKGRAKVRVKANRDKAAEVGSSKLKMASRVNRGKDKARDRAARVVADSAVEEVNPPVRLVRSAIASLAAAWEMLPPKAAAIAMVAAGILATHALPDKLRRLSRAQIRPIRSARSIRV